MSRPGVFGGRKGVCSRAISGPGAKPRTLRVPAHKVQLRIGVVPVRRWYPALSIKCWFGQPAASRTPALDKEVVHVRCTPVGNFLVVAPVLGRSASKSQQSAGGPARFCCLHSSVRLRRVYTWPLFLHTSAGVNPARSVPDVNDASVRIAPGCWRRQCRSKSATDCAGENRWCQAFGRERTTFVRAAGPMGPGPGGRLPPTTAGLCRRPGA